jgi:hypothetical protein
MMARKKKIPNIPMNAIGDWASEIGHKILDLHAQLRGIQIALENDKPVIAKEYADKARAAWQEIFDMWCGGESE